MRCMGWDLQHQMVLEEKGVCSVQELQELHFPGENALGDRKVMRRTSSSTCSFCLWKPESGAERKFFACSGHVLKGYR